MKALVGAFNQEKALIGAFSVIVQPVVEPMEHYTALILLVVESLLLDHGEVALPALSLTAVVVAHGSRHLLVVHLLRPVGLHLTPRPGELQGVGHL